jgi:hypothetical protein
MGIALTLRMALNTASPCPISGLQSSLLFQCNLRGELHAENNIEVFIAGAQGEAAYA